MNEDIRQSNLKQMSNGIKLFQIEQAVRKWMNKQGHDRCWYYPEIFQEIIEILEIKELVHYTAIDRKEFEGGCHRYQDELFK